MTPTRQLLSLRPSSRPHDLQWLEKGVLNCPLQPQLVRISLPGQSREQGPGTKGGVRLPREETPSPGTRRTPHSSHRHWAPPYWTNTRSPPRANHRGAKVPAAPPNKKYWEGNLSKKAEFKVCLFRLSSSTLKPVTLLSFFSFFCV